MTIEFRDEMLDRRAWINFPKEAHQTSDGPLVDFHDCFDDVVAQFGVRKGLAEPVELLDRALPRQWITETGLRTELLAIEKCGHLCLDGDARVQLVRYFEVKTSSGRISTLLNRAWASAAWTRDCSS